MTPAGRFAVALVTTPNMKVARQLAEAALTRRLIACANLVPHLESHYWWKGKIEQGKEVLLLMKTSVAKLGALEKLILKEHPYETPEFIVLPLNKGNERYLKWIASSVRGRRD